MYDSAGCMSDGMIDGWNGWDGIEETPCTVLNGSDLAGRCECRCGYIKNQPVDELFHFFQVLRITNFFILRALLFLVVVLLLVRQQQP